MRVRVSRPDRRAIQRGLRRPRRTATLRITVTATDAARNARRRTVRVRIVR
jgi:hypothetical protein